MTTHKAQLLVPAKADLGEGPIWDAQSNLLFWVDIVGCRLHAFNPSANTLETRQFNEPVGSVAVYPGRRLLVAFAKRIAWLEWESGETQTVCPVEPGKPENRCNDGKVDPAGRFWIGTMGKRAGEGTLYRLDGEQLTPMVENVTISNGIGWTGDHGTMFYIDTPTRQIWAYDFDSDTSEISNRRTIVEVPPKFGLPDGLTVATDDTIWVAGWGGGCVCRWDPSTGELLEKIETGCPHTTSCTFGGPERKQLYITTARRGLSEEALIAAPDSGGLFVAEPFG